MRIFLFAVVIILSGCSAKYVTPVDGDRAQLRVVAPDFGGWAGLRLVYYEEGSCDKPYVFALISGLGTTKSDEKLNIPKTELSETSEYVDRFIKAGKVKMTIQSSFANARCSIPFEATLEKDKQYQFLHFWADERCVASINEITEHGLVEIKVDRPDKACWTGFSGSAL